MEKQPLGRVQHFVYTANEIAMKDLRSHFDNLTTFLSLNHFDLMHSFDEASKQYLSNLKRMLTW